MILMSSSPLCSSYLFLTSPPGAGRQGGSEKDRRRLRAHHHCQANLAGAPNPSAPATREPHAGQPVLEKSGSLAR